VKTDEAENESDPGDPTAGAVTSPPQKRRVAEVWTDEQTKQNSAIFTALTEAYEWAEKAEVEQQAEKHNWMKRVALKTAKIVVCVGLFAITAILGASGIGIALLGLGVGLAFAAMEAYQSYKEGQTAGGVGAFVFNVVKGGAMTALGLEVRHDPCTAAPHALPYAPVPFPTVSPTLSPQSADLLRVGRPGCQHSRSSVHQ